MWNWFAAAVIIVEQLLIDALNNNADTQLGDYCGEWKSSVFKMLEYGNQWHHIYDMNHEKWDYNIIGLKNFVYYYITGIR